MFTPKRRVLGLLIAAGFIGAIAVPLITVSSASYTDVAKANAQNLGLSKAFGLEVKANGNGDAWKPASTEATAAIVLAVSDTNIPSGAASTPLIVSSSVRVSTAALVRGHIVPTIQPPSTCTDTCASIYDYAIITAWWGTSATPKVTQIGTGLSITEFNALSARDIIGTPGEEHLLTLSITLQRPPIDVYGGVNTVIGIVYNGATDSAIG